MGPTPEPTSKKPELNLFLDLSSVKGVENKCNHQIDIDSIEYHKNGRVGICKKCGTKLYLITKRKIKARGRFKGSKKARLKDRALNKKKVAQTLFKEKLPERPGGEQKIRE